MALPELSVITGFCRLLFDLNGLRSPKVKDINVVCTGETVANIPSKYIPD